MRYLAFAMYGLTIDQTLKCDIRHRLQTIIPPIALDLQGAEQSAALIQSICSCVITFD
jgi:hypothetical protein